MITAKRTCVVLKLCSLACLSGWSTPTALANFHNFTPFVHPALNIDFIAMSTWNPSGVTHPGSPVIISNGIHFVGTVLEVNEYSYGLETPIDFHWEHPRGLRSMSYEAFGGYSLENTSTEEVIASVALFVEVWDVNGVPTPLLGRAASASTRFGKDAAVASAGEWSLKVDLNFDEIVGAGNHLTKASVFTTAYASYLPYLVAGEGRLWTDSIRLTFVPVPEPTGFALAGVGISVLGLARRLSLACRQ